jgi:hypothetical protein
MLASVRFPLPVLGALLWALCSMPLLAEADKDREVLEIRFLRMESGYGLCEVVFPKELPERTKVDAIIKKVMEVAILADPAGDIQVTAVTDDGLTRLRPTEFSGSIFFRAEDKKVFTEEQWDEQLGHRKVTQKRADYTVVFKSFPLHDSIVIDIFFEREPTRERAYEAAVAETEKIAKTGKSVLEATVLIGDPESKKKGTQATFMKDSADDGVVWVNYDHVTKQITRKDKLIKQLK